MDAVQLNFELHGSVCLVRVSGELTAGPERAFTGRALPARAAGAGPVALAAVPSREATLYQCSPALRRVLGAFGLDLPLAGTTGPALGPALTLMPTGADLAAAPRVTPAGSPSDGEALVARVQLTCSSAGQSALRASEVMSRLAATYATLALNRLYRLPDKSADRGRRLALSGRASDLSQQYPRYAGGEAG